MEKNALIVPPLLLRTGRYKEMFSNQRGIRSGGGRKRRNLTVDSRGAWLRVHRRHRRRRRRRLFVHPFEINNRVDRIETGPLFASKYRYDADDD